MNGDGFTAHLGLFLMLAGGLTACDDDVVKSEKSEAGSHREPDARAPGAPDASSLPPRDSGTGSAVREAAAETGVVDAPVIAVPTCNGDPPIMKVLDQDTNTESSPDFSCYALDGGEGGGPVLPDAGFDAGDGSTGQVAFVSGLSLLPSLVDGVTVDFFFGPSTLGTPDATRLFAANGVTTFPAPSRGATLSVRLHGIERSDPSYSIGEIREYGFPRPVPGSSVVGRVLIRPSRDLIVNLALGGSQDDPQKALLLSTVRDCRGGVVGGAQFELIDGETNRPVPTGGANEPVSSYFQFALPIPGCTYTTNQQQEAAWVLVNAPVNVVDGKKTHSYRLRLKGRMRESDVAPVLLAESEVELLAGVMSAVRLYR